MFWILVPEKNDKLRDEKNQSRANNESYEIYFQNNVLFICICV